MSDLVDGLIKLMESNYTGPVNLGNPIEQTVEGTYKIRLKIFRNINYFRT